MTINLKVNKKIVAVMVSLLAIVIVLIGTFAWSNFTQRARNVFEGFVQPEVNLHDDFWQPNKDVYVENSGEKTVFVRVNFKEFLEVAKQSIYPGSVFNDGESWEKHYDPSNPSNPCPVDDCGLEFHDYYTWLMGNALGDPNAGWKWYIPAPTELKAQFDLDGKYIDGTSKTVYGIDYTTEDANGKTVPTPQVSSKNKTYAQITAEMATNAAYQNLLTTYKNANVATKPAAKTAMTNFAFDTWGVKMTETTVSVLTMKDWIASGSIPGKFWVMDTDGWFYWAEGVAPGVTTGLLLSEVANIAKPTDDWFYAIDVYLNAVTEDDFNALGTMGLTENALKLLYVSTGNYKDSGLKDGGKTIWYKSLGENVYQQGVINIDSNGASSWARQGEFTAGSTGSAPFTPANFVMASADGWPVSTNTSFNFENATLPTDAKGGMLNFNAGGTEKILGIEKGIDGHYYYKLGDGVYTRALTSSETMKISNVDTAGSGLLGVGPHKVVWVPQDAKLGDKSNLTVNPWYISNISDPTSGKATYYHLGSGVFYLAATQSSTTPVEPRYTNGAGTVVEAPKPYISASDRATINTETATPSNLFLHVGQYYTKAAGGAYTNSNSGAVKPDGTGAFMIVDVIKSAVNGKYYIKVDDGRKGDDGTPQYAYYASSDETLGNTDDVKTWPGTQGIGSRDDTTVAPSSIPKSVTVGSTFNQLGKFWQNNTNTAIDPTEAIVWDVVEIKGTKALLVSRNPIYVARFDGTNTTSWADSEIRAWLNTTFVDKSLKDGYLGNVGKNQIALTEVNTGIINGAPNPGNNYYTTTPDLTGDATSKTNGGKTLDYFFLLSKPEYQKYYTPAQLVVTFTKYCNSIINGSYEYYAREKHPNLSYSTSYAVGYGGFHNHLTTDKYGIRPAFWMEFDSTKWGKYGSAGTGGNWKANNSNTASGTIWQP